MKTKQVTDRLEACEAARSELADKIPRLLASLSALTQEKEKLRDENRTLTQQLTLANTEKTEAMLQMQIA